MLVGNRWRVFSSAGNVHLMNGSFDGQVVMITGAAQGLGLAMAEAFLEEGAVVVGTDVNDTGLRAAARHQSGLEIHRMDVTRPGEIRQVVKAVAGRRRREVQARYGFERIIGATPTRAAISRRLSLPSSGNSAIKVALATGPMPLAERSSLSNSA